MSVQQTIQWFPGHMAKAEKQIARDLSLADAVVEILDARIPLSSRNPDLNRLANGKPRILLLNRRDLADPAETARWIDFFHASGKAALDADCRSGKNLSRLLPLIKSTLGDKIAGWQRKGMTGRRIRVMAVGIPNVGKSSLINRLAGSGRAAVQNRPGVTRSTQWFSIGGGCEMMDTPGVLWPKFGDRTVGEHLAFTGAVKEDICDAEELAPRLLEALCAAGYARTLAERYGLSEDGLAGLDGYGMLELIGRKRGMLAGGGRVDTERAARMVLDEFRAGRLGRITLERAEKMTDWYFYEKEARQSGFGAVCGIDEAGRGPLAGPVFAAAVILPEECSIEGINDSKKLSPKKRGKLFGEIKAGAEAWGIGFATEQEIDEINILQATFLAMRRACNALEIRPDLALVDGNRMPELGVRTRTIVRGDSLSASIAAASILAKVSRDRLMCEVDKIYPQYGFAKHKGYGTALHREMLQKYGPCPVHRRTFLKKILGARADEG